MYNIGGDENMIFYYGADKEIFEPKYNTGNPSNDYGLGFYLTPDKEMAILWASKFPQGGYVIKYEVDVDKLNICHLNTISDENVLLWISVLIAHRFSKDERREHAKNIEWLENNYHLDLDKYDAIVGYRADDSYFDYSRDFVANDLSLQILKEAMMLGKLGIQFVLKSKKAFSHIRFLESERVPHSNSYEAFRMKTKQEYLMLKKEDDDLNTF